MLELDVSRNQVVYCPVGIIVGNFFPNGRIKFEELIQRLNIFKPSPMREGFRVLLESDLLGLCSVNRVYLDKLANLKAQLAQLAEGTHPEYNKKLKRLDIQHRERSVSQLYVGAEPAVCAVTGPRTRRSPSRITCGSSVSDNVPADHALSSTLFPVPFRLNT